MAELTLNLAVDEVDITIAPYFTGREDDLDLEAIADDVRTSVETRIEQALDSERTGVVTVTWNVDGITAHLPSSSQLTYRDLEAAFAAATGPVEDGGVDLDAVAAGHTLPNEDRDAPAVAKHAKQGFPPYLGTVGATRQAAAPIAGAEANRSSDLER